MTDPFSAFCGSCGASVTASNPNCGACGAALQRTCTSCESRNPASNRFCEVCGDRLPDAGDGPAPRLERRQVSVLFADLVGFTAFSDGRDPEDVRRLAMAYSDVAAEIVTRHAGAVEKYIGDAVMAWWGATRAREDDAVRAVDSAIELVERIPDLGRSLGIPDLEARAAVMTGETVVGPASPARGALLGDLVNTTARLQSIADPGTVVVGSVTADLVRATFETIDHGSRLVRGKSEPLAFVEVRRPVRPHQDDGANTLLPPFVGRGAELDRLRRLHESVVVERRPRVVTVVGQAGIGKSRLLAAFRDDVGTGVEWHVGTSPPDGGRLPMWALGEVVRSIVGIEPGMPTEEAGEILAAAVRRLVPAEGEWVVSRLAVLLALGDVDIADRGELATAAHRLIEGLSADRPVVLVFEDLHFAGPGVLRFVEELPSWLPDLPVMVVAVARPDLLDRSSPIGENLDVGPLDDGEMETLVSGAVPNLGPDVVDRVVDRAAGVPLFAVETLRMLLGGGGEDGSAIPSSIQAVVGARLDRLPGAARRVVREAAVLGPEFSIDHLRRLRDDGDDAALSDVLAELVARQVLSAPSPADHGRFRWVQAVVREVAYRRIALVDRAQLHARAARYFRNSPDPALSPLEVSHLVAASLSVADGRFRDDLAAAARRALRWSTSLHAHEQVIDLVELALPGVDADSELEFRELAARAACRVTDVETADRHVEALQVAAAETGRVDVGHRAVALAAMVAVETQRWDRHMDSTAAHLDRYPDLDAHPSLASAAVALARSRLLSGDLAGSARLAERASDAARRHGLKAEAADCMVTFATAIARTDPTEAYRVISSAIEQADACGAIDVKLRAYVNLGYVTQDFDVMATSWAQAFAISRRIGDRWHGTFAGRLLASLQITRLELDEADAILDDPVLSREGVHAPAYHGLRGYIHALRGAFDLASAEVEAGRRARERLTDPPQARHLAEVPAMVAYLRGDPRPLFEVLVEPIGSDPFVEPQDVVDVVALALLGGWTDQLPPGAELMAVVSGTVMEEVTRALIAAAFEAEPGLIAGHIDAALTALSAAGQIRRIEIAVNLAGSVAVPALEGERYADRALEVASETNAAGVIDFVAHVTGRRRRGGRR